MDDIQAILDQLEDKELDFVTERSKVTSDAAAYNAAGIARSTFYGWPADRRAQLNEWAQALKRATKYRAQRVLEEHAENAAKRIVLLIMSADEAVAYRAAKDILDRVVGRPRQSVDLTSGGEPMKLYQGWNPDDWDDDGSEGQDDSVAETDDSGE